MENITTTLNTTASLNGDGVTNSNSFSTYDIFLISMYSLLCMFIIGGNSLVIIVYMREKLVRAVLFNMYIINLAVADFMVGVFVVPTFLYLYSLHKLFQIPNFVSTIVGAISGLSVALSVAVVIWMTFDRLRMVLNPIKYRASSTFQNTLRRVVIMWIACLAYYGGYYLVLFLAYLVQGQADDMTFLLTSLCQTVMAFAIPFCVIMFLNLTFFCLLKRRLNSFKGNHLSTSHQIAMQSRHMKSKSTDIDIREPTGKVHTSSNDRSKSSRITSSTSLKDSQLHGNIKRAKSLQIISRNLFILVSVYLICWLPFQIIILLSAFAIPFPQRVYDAVTFLLVINSAINPCIYAATNKMMRNGMWKLICLPQCHRSFNKSMPGNGKRSTGVSSITKETGGRNK